MLSKEDITNYLEYMHKKDPDLTLCIKCDQDYNDSIGEIEIALENLHNKDHPCIILQETSLIAIEQSYKTVDNTAVYEYDNCSHLIPYSTIRIITDNY